MVGAFYYFFVCFLCMYVQYVYVHCNAVVMGCVIETSFSTQETNLLFFFKLVLGEGLVQYIYRVCVQ